MMSLGEAMDRLRQKSKAIIGPKVESHCRWRVLLVCMTDTYNVGIKEISDGAVEALEVPGYQEILSHRLGSQIQIHIQVGVRLQ